MATTEFCCRSGGSNLNAGTRTGNSTVPGTAADFTYASGNWVASTGVFTVASGNPSSDGVEVGDWASVYENGSTQTSFVGIVTARDTTTITVSLTVRHGTAAPTDGTGNRTLKIGGAWQGPNGSESFPFSLSGGAQFIQRATNPSSFALRINFKNDADYNITATIIFNLTTIGGPNIEGFTTVYGDQGVATIDGGTTGASYNLLTFTGGRWMTLAGFHFKNNGATGNADGVVGSVGNLFERITVSDVRGSGLSTISMVDRCNFYNCNQSNTLGKGGVDVASPNVHLNACVFSHNTGSNNAGVSLQNFPAISYINCVFAENTFGIRANSNYMTGLISGCAFYKNTYGIYSINAGFGPLIVENSVFCYSTTNDIFVHNSGDLVRVRNCAFGSGTMAAGSGTYGSGVESQESNNITLDANITPWIDPANGDFRINLTSVKGTGYGAYTMRKGGYSGTVAYPDIGAAQSNAGAGAGGGVRAVNINGGATQ